MPRRCSAAWAHRVGIERCRRRSRAVPKPYDAHTGIVNARPCRDPLVPMSDHSENLCSRPDYAALCAPSVAGDDPPIDLRRGLHGSTRRGSPIRQHREWCSNAGPTSGESRASKNPGPGPAPRFGCWQAPSHSDGTRGAPRPDGPLCDIEQLRLAPPVMLRQIVDTEVRTVGVPWAVEVTFGEPDLSRLEQYTARLAADGGYVAILLNQQLLSVSRVVDRVTDGSLTIAGDFTRDQAMELQERLTGSSQGA